MLKLKITLYIKVHYLTKSNNDMLMLIKYEEQRKMSTCKIKNNQSTITGIKLMFHQSLTHNFRSKQFS